MNDSFLNTLDPILLDPIIASLDDPAEDCSYMYYPFLNILDSIVLDQNILDQII